MALLWVKEGCFITDGVARGRDNGVNVESVVSPPVIIVVLTLTIYWIVVWFVSGRLGPDLKALP